MTEEIRRKAYGTCLNLVSDGAGDYCKILKILEKDYPHKYRRVFCYGNLDNLVCKESKRRFGLKEGLEGLS